MIYFLTGKYGGFTAIENILYNLQEPFRIIPTSQHYQREFTIRTLRFNWGDNLIEFPNNKQTHFGLCAQTFASLSTIKVPKYSKVVVYGDRADALLGMLWAKHIPTMKGYHIQAGDVSGGIDNSIRTSTSELADVLFCSSMRAIDNCKVYWPHKKVIYSGELHHETLMRNARNNSTMLEPGTVLLHMHPDTLETESKNAWIWRNVMTALEYLLETGVVKKVIQVPPCNDPMNNKIGKKWVTEEWFAPKEYTGMLLTADAIVGNSSSFVLETSFLGVQNKVTLIGDRQKDRQEGLKSYVKVDEIIASIFDNLRLPRLGVRTLFPIPSEIISMELMNG